MSATVEPWLRNTHTSLDPIRRQVIHALELAGEDCLRWCEDLTADEHNVRPFGLPSVAFQLHHMGGSLDRLLTYAEGRALDESQLAALRCESEPAERAELLERFNQAMERSQERVLALSPDAYEQVRYVGRDRLPTTAGALLIHCAEHTQRHTGQMITTAKLLLALRSRAVSPML